MRKSTMIGLFILLSYIVLFVGIFGDDKAVLAGAFVLVVLNVLAFWLSYLRPIFPSRHSLSLYLEEERKKMRIKKHRGKSDLSTFQEEQKMMSEMSSSVMVAFLSTVLLVGITFVVDTMLFKIPNMGFVIFSYLMITMLIMRMQWVHHAEVELAAEAVNLA
ncbi:MAG: hypothetical protein QW568_01870 [Candidatus Anstonellaceae archaeon]